MADDAPPQPLGSPSIVELLRDGQEIVVQVVKDPIGSKGARLTTQISIPSRYLVLLPQSRTVGVSARIEDEAERLRLAAEAEAFARTEAEQALGKATGRQTAQLSAARRKEAELARQEAELVSGKKLPASTFGSQGEVFVLPGATFESGKSGLTGSGRDAAAALAAYLQIGKRAVRIRAWDKDSKVAIARAAALREALVAAGVDKGRIKADGVRDPATSRRAAEVTIAP